MSHMAKIELEINDLGSLQAACEQLGWTFVENQTRYKWYGKYMNDWPLPEGVKQSELGTCDHAIKVPGAYYEIGVKKLPSGNFTIVYDFWHTGGLVQKIGQDGGPLRQAYAVQRVKKAAKKKKHRIKSINKLEDGTVKLVLKV